MSQNPDTKDYIIILNYAEGGNFNDRNHKNFHWVNKLLILIDIIEGLNEIHQKQMVHQICNRKYIIKYAKYNNIYIFLIWDYVEKLIIQIEQIFMELCLM